MVDHVAHAADATVRPLRWLASALVVCAAVAVGLAGAAPALRVEASALAILFGAAGWGTRFRVRAFVRAAMLSASRNELARGALVSADHLVDRAEEGRGANRLAIAFHRAEIALARGDAAAAVALLRAALVERGAGTSRGRGYGLSIRAAHAFASALAGDDETATSEISAVRQDVELRRYGRGVLMPVANVRSALARVALAEIVVASRGAGGRAPEGATPTFDAGRVEALVAASKKLVLDAANARERALLLALERMAVARVQSVYRAPPPRGAADGGRPVEWVARVMPDAATYARSRGGKSEAAAPPSAHVAPRPSRIGPRARVRAVVALVVALIGFVVLVVARPPERPFDPMHGLGVVALVVAGVVIAGAFTQRRALASVVGANDVFARAATSPTNVARALLSSLETEGAPAVVVASAEIALSRLARSSGDLEAALAHADAAVDAVDRSATPLEVTEIRAEAVAERAVALAVLGRADEARRAASETPMFFAARAALEVRVALFGALASGDVEGARVVARDVSEHLALDRRSELVVDLLRATSANVGAGLAVDERVRAELDEPLARAFIDAAAPSLVALFDASAAAPG